MISSVPGRELGATERNYQNIEQINNKQCNLHTRKRVWETAAPTTVTLTTNNSATIFVLVMSLSADAAKRYKFTPVATRTSPNRSGRQQCCCCCFQSVSETPASWQDTPLFPPTPTKTPVTPVVVFSRIFTTTRNHIAWAVPIIVWSSFITRRAVFIIAIIVFWFRKSVNSAGLSCPRKRRRFGQLLQRWKKPHKRSWVKRDKRRRSWKRTTTTTTRPRRLRLHRIECKW